MQRHRPHLLEKVVGFLTVDATGTTRNQMLALARDLYTTTQRKMRCKALARYYHNASATDQGV
eukprot:1288764-Pyramimonas_sp.AAC.3